MLRAALLEGLASGAVTLPPNSAPDVLDQLRAALYRTDWVVYAKAPFGGAEQVYAYLGRYTHRVGISNARIRSVDERGVTFATKGGRECTLAGGRVSPALRRPRAHQGLHAHPTLRAAGALPRDDHPGARAGADHAVAAAVADRADR